jgi:hypothetical protein
MTERTLKCGSCGALWISLPAREIVERSGNCLRCGSPLQEEESPDAEREGSAEDCPETPGAEPI